MKIAMIGTGYVGLVSGACFADFGHEVVCVDNDAAKIAALQRREIPIFEPGLADLVENNAAHERLSFTTDIGPAVATAQVVFLAVGTPARRGDGHADLSYVYQAAREVAAHLVDYTVIVTKSTVPVGTGDEVEKIISEARPDVQFAVVSNPEFLREGAAIEDFKRPDRIVIGSDDDHAQQVMHDVYRPLRLNAPPIIQSSRRSAELIKYAGNAFLAMKITFINEIADLCEKVGASVQDVAMGIGSDQRIGGKFLNAGPGFGGSCFPKDSLALMRTAQDAGSPLRLVETTVAVNDARKQAMAGKVIAAAGGHVSGKRIGILGLTFKPNTDDMRDAPSLAIIEALLAAGSQICAYDPEGMEQARAMLDDRVMFAVGPYECASDVDVCVIVTEWDEFRALDLERMAGLMARPVLVDLRNIYERGEVERAGISYAGIG